MKKILKNTTFLLIIACFCSFLCFENYSKPIYIKSRASFPTELEMKEYQEIEHGIMINAESNEIDANNFHSVRYTIVLDAGHGGSDPGSIGYKTKTKESDINLKLVKSLAKKLEDAGLCVVLTRTDENALAEGRGKAFKKEDMAKRKELIISTRPNLVISLHQNSSRNHSFRGAQVFYDKTSDISKQIADLIQKEFNDSLVMGKKYASPGDYYMLKCTDSPSVIVECGFLSNADDEKLLLSSDYQEKIVNAICRGIINFLQTK